MWWLLACQTPSIDWEESYKNSPGQVVLDLQDVVDPTERLAIVESLQQTFPGQTEELCGVLPKSTQEYCIERNRRPHLWMPLKERSFTADDESKLSVDAVQSSCTDVACRIEESLEYARRGQIAQVQTLCTFSSTKEEHECLFATAEKLVEKNGVMQYSGAVEICRLAKSFSTNCQNHLIQQMAKDAPDADTKSDWRVILTAHRAIQTTWGWRDETMQNQLQHRLWSEAIGVSYAGADRIVGNPLDVVPKEYHCHIYSAAAWRLFQLEEPSKRTLDEWTAYLEVRLQDRSERAESIDFQRKFRAASNLWSLSEGSSQQDIVPYLSTSFRVRSQILSNELALSILEAIARQPPIAIAILDSGVLSQDVLIQQTAKRLRSKLPIED